MKDYPRSFSGVANKNVPERGRFGSARMKWKPNPKSIGIRNISSKVSRRRPWKCC